MPETKFTPGPWWGTKSGYLARSFELGEGANGSNDYQIGGVTIRSETGTVADVNYTDRADNRGIADARLITAAPDLYHALLLAMPYVIDAYECAFPNEAENAQVLDAVRTALAKARGEATQ